MEDKQWFLYVSDHHEGPFTIEEIKNLVKGGEARSSSYVWKEGYEDWVMMSDVAEFGVAAAQGEGHGAFSFLNSLFKKSSEEQKEINTAAPQQITKTPLSVQAVQAVSVAHIDVSESVFCLNSRHTFSGPYSLKNIIRKLNSGEIALSDTVWCEGWTGFVSLANIPEVMKEAKATLTNPAVAVATKGVSTRSGISIPKYKFWKGRIFLFFVMIFLPLATYQYIAKTSWQGLKLPPLPLDPVIDTVIGLAGKIPEKLEPVVDALSEHLPEGVMEYFSPISNIPHLSKDRFAAMKVAVRKPLAQGAEVVVGLPENEELNPTFYIATNLPEGTSLLVSLKGRAGTLLNALSYEKTMSVEVAKHMARTLKFTYEATKPLPRGEYVLTVYEADKQPSEVMTQLSGLPKRKTPALIPQGKAAFAVDILFLGGKKDETYKIRLAEFLQKVNSRLALEITELQQIVALIASNTEEDAKKFTTVFTIKNPKQKFALWQQHSGRYEKMLAQLRTNTVKSADVLSREYVRGDLYLRAADIVAKSASLHDLYTTAVQNPAIYDPNQIQNIQQTYVKAIQQLYDVISKESATLQEQNQKSQNSKPSAR